eukprot:CAMPEP_0178917168 /NCGR_PEP_ID=MMETSP0786-20121207/13094_1 /TAXON_ID=186022 /ORGANISM="Thalassionema frauenfeldii, Strain CCMP 1798" /LENGTH=375 /DNA_ID=CAMNT_0020590683 /DNA_START=74 /DNA_END=1202 /DNA_ORIENTATION=+
MPSLPASLRSSSLSSNSIKGNNTHHAISTEKALTHIEDRILPYQDLDFVWDDIQVFWLPLRGYNKEEEELEEGENNSTGESSTEKKTTKKNGKNYTLKAARPPDSSVGVSEWRWCHMGIILVATSKNDDAVQLQVLIDLHNSGIRIHHVFGKNAQRKMHDFLFQLCANDDAVPIYSAGVKQDVVAEQQELESIRQVVQSVRSYNVVYFNCQHFTSIAYQHFTGLSLRHKLRQRWTSNHRFSFTNSTINAISNDSGNNKKKSITISNFEKAVSQHECLQRLQLVDAEELLWSYTPKFLGKTNRAAMVGGLMLAAASAPLTGLAVTAMGVGYDKMHPTVLFPDRPFGFNTWEANGIGPPIAAAMSKIGVGCLHATFG